MIKLQPKFIKFVAALLIVCELLIITPAVTYATRGDAQEDAADDDHPDRPADYVPLPDAEADGLVTVETPDTDPYRSPGYIDFSNPDLTGVPLTEFEEATDQAALNTLPASVDSSLTVKPAVVLNSTDKRILNNIVLLNSAMPDLFVDINELARLNSSTQEAMEALRASDPKAYLKLVEDTTTKISNSSYLKSRLLTGSPDMLVIMETLFQVSQSSILVQLNDPIQKKSIETALDEMLSVQIDRRIIETLNYLVRPKDDPNGGAGHTKVVVSRIWKNFTSQDDDRNLSKESDANNQKMNEQQSEAAGNQTVEQYTAQTDTDAVSSLLSNAGLGDSDPLVTGQIVDTPSSSQDATAATGSTGISTTGLSDTGSATSDITDFAVTDVDSIRNISAHAKGQAIDISSIDSINCTLIKKRHFLSDKKIPQPPVDIKLKWQTTEGYNADASAISSSYNEMFKSAAQSSLIEMLSELNVDFENIDKIDLSNFGDMAAIVGQAFFASALNTQGGDEIWKFKLSDILRKMGGVILADGIALDRAPFLDTSINSINDLAQAVGRYNIEKKLGLPYGSMTGATKDEMLENIGRERLAKELSLPSGTFKFQYSSIDDIYQRIGARLFESYFDFPENTFYNKNSLADISSVINPYKIKAVFAFPEALDGNFFLARGTSKALIQGKLSVKDYIKLIAQAHLGQVAYTYQSYRPVGDATDPFGYCVPISKIGGSYDAASCAQWTAYAAAKSEVRVSATYSAAQVYNVGETVVFANRNYQLNAVVPAGTLPNTSSAWTDLGDVTWRDEMMNLPPGAMEKLLGTTNSALAGTIDASDFKRIGVYSITRTLESSAAGRNYLSQWFASPNLSLTVNLPIPAYEPGSDYQVGNVVEFLDDTYVMVKDAPKGTEPGSSSEFWHQNGATRAYDNASDYNLGDYVEYENRDYIMTADAPAGVLPTDTSKWLSMANAGGMYSFPSQSYASNLGILPDDFYRLFGSNVNPQGIYKRIGEKLLVDGIKNSSFVERQRESLMQNSSVADAIETYEFYKTRIDAIQEHFPRITQAKDNLISSMNSVPESVLPQSQRDNYKSLIELFERSTGEAKGTDPHDLTAMSSKVNILISNSDMLNSQTTSMLTALKGSSIGTVTNLVNKINALNMEVEIVARNGLEIISGHEQPNFRIEDLSAATVTGRLNIDLGGSSVGRGDLLLLLAGQITIKDYLLSVGSAKIAENLNIPPKAFKYAAYAIDRLVTGHSSVKDAFFRAFGMA